jgi:ribosomal-protein-alanine N-acetyltransferase
MSDEPLHTPHALAAPAPVRVESPWSIRTDRMVIRRILPVDRDAFLRAVAASRTALDRFCPLHRDGESDHRLFDRLLLQGGGDGPGHVSLRTVGVLPDGAIAGGFSLVSIAAGLELKASINWWIASGLEGRGLATEGVDAVLGHALSDRPPLGDGLGLHFVEAWITRDNVASARVAAKVGLRRSGEPSYLRAGERWVLHDHYVRRVDNQPG